MPVGDLNAVDGVTILLAKLDKHFQKNAIDSAYEAYRDFDKLSRQPDQSLTDFIECFEKKHSALRKYSMTLPETVQGCKLIETAELDTREKQMILSAYGNLEHGTVRSAIERIFGSSVATTSRTSIKSESLYANKRKPLTAMTKRKNPRDKNGKISRSAICESIYHWARNFRQRTTIRRQKVWIPRRYSPFGKLSN